MDEKELLHWGIKGMKWGVRRYQNKDGTLTPAGKKRYNASSESEAKSMSDQELRSKINRMDLERQYSSLRKETVSEGKVNAAKILEIAGDVLTIGASATAIAVSIKKLANG